MSEPVQITKEQWTQLVRYVEGLTHRIAALEQPKNQDSDWYIERVKAGKTVCSGCANGMYCYKKKLNDEKIFIWDFDFAACLINSNLDAATIQCNQFVSSIKALDPDDYPDIPY